MNMDGELEFTVPDMKIKSIDLIVYGSGNPKLQEIRNSENKSVDYKKNTVMMLPMHIILCRMLPKAAGI